MRPLHSLLNKDRIIAPPGFNRWRVPPCSIAIYLCIGSVYAWSVLNGSLTKVRGVVVSAADDWTLPQVVTVFTVAIVFLGLSAAVAGRWLEKVGPRLVGTTAALCWGGGFFISAAGIHWHQLWLLYLGYGVIGGIGLGLGYVSPVSTLIRWFPDRRGMASGMAIMGFGGGAIIAQPVKDFLIRYFYRQPDYLGTVDSISLHTQSGRRFADLAGKLQEVVVVGTNDLTQMIQQGPEGVYVVGTGSVGVTETFVVLGVVYLLVMLVAAFAYRIPGPGWQPAGWSPKNIGQGANRMISAHNVDVNEALRTPQFYLLWIVLCLNVTAGIGILGVAKTMISELFGAALPQIVTSRFAGTFVLMTSLFNMLGRFFWASASDHLGRKRTYAIFFALGGALYLTIPWIAQRGAASTETTWLIAFYAVTMLIFTMYGGGFATIPAYLADLFGTKLVGGIHGRLLTAWSTAGVLGPQALAWLRERAVNRAVTQLAAQVDPAEFEARFGAPLAQLAALTKTKTVTIAKLLELAPAGTPDPASQVYNEAMVLMAGLLAIALVANALVRPVDARHYMHEPGAG